MSTLMWIVGSVIFGVYMWFTIWNITRNKVEEETTDDERFDVVDMDGMGNFSRFPKKDMNWYIAIVICLSGGIGRHARLRI